jgi:beta-lactamase regulating signal transducer with metallopeptidase domain/protocatechuate 3,4-dioxygenase beta subunit
MSALESLLQQPPVIRAGWTLIHFLWQGSVIAIFLAAVRGAAGNWMGARARYALSCLALALMAAAPPVTYLFLGRLGAAPLPGPIWQVDARAWDRVLPWVVVVWLLGAALFSARVAMGWRKATRVRRAAVALPPPEWQDALERLVRQMRVSPPVRLLLSPLAAAPAVVGWLKPVILMPVEAVVGVPLNQVRSLLAHELAHIRRNDYLVNILQSLAEALLFYHPAVWWVSGQIRAERELCCDDIAVEASDDVLTYATALASLETFRRARLKAAMAADGGSLLSRIRRLAGQTESPHNFPGPAAAWALALLWVAGAGAVAMHANQPPLVRALRPFAMPGIAAAPQVYLDPPKVAMRTPAALLSALLFDPFFAAPQAPAQSGASDEEKKLASLSGTVFSTAGKPVQDATVRLLSANPPTPVVTSSGGAAVMSGASATTQPAARSDAEGKFSFMRVPPGSYTVQFQAKNVLTTTYGARPGLSTGTVVTLDEGSTVTDINMKLPEPGIFVGRLVDEDGDPLAAWSVGPQIKRYYYPEPRGEVYTYVRTGDNGEFRITVTPGRYYMSAWPMPLWNSNERAPAHNRKPGEKVFAPEATYLGGVVSLKEATPVDIGAGQVINLGNCKIQSQPSVHIRGKVIGDPALLKGTRVTRVPTANFVICWTCGADVQADGSFDLYNVYPDQFTIGAYAQRLGFLGFTDVSVVDEDLNNIQINAQALPLSGAVAIEGSTAGMQPAPPGGSQGGMGAMGVGDGASGMATAQAASQAVPPLTGRIELTSTGRYKVSSNAAVRPDGSFSFTSVAPGAYFLNITGLPRDYYVKTARQGSRDVLNENLDWGGDNGPMEIVVSREAPVMEGSVVDADGNPVPGTVTLVADPQRPGHTMLYPTAKADQKGKFRFQSVAPGSYRVFAWESIPDGAHAVPDFIDSFMGAGERVQLKERDRKTMAVKRISLDSMDATLRRAGK